MAASLAPPDAPIQVGFTITKKEDHDDGTVTVYGRPTTGRLDFDRQIVDPAFMRRALPEWFHQWGNIREMHAPRAVGRAKSLDFDDADQPWLAAHVVDREAVQKVRAGVLQAFSVGIHHPRLQHDPQAPGGRIVDGEVLEVSLVDRPSDPDCRYMVVKSAKHGETWDETRSPELAPVGPLDALGQPVLQPGHVQSNAAQISVVTMDDRGILVQMGPDQYLVPYTVVDGAYRFSEPRRMPTDPRALPDDARGHLPPSEGGVKVAEPKKDVRDFDPDVGGGVDRDQLPASDFIDPERRRFPIVKPGDVSDAVSSYGRAKPPIPYEHFRERLEAIARRKGEAFERALPAEWRAEKGATMSNSNVVQLVKAAEDHVKEHGYCVKCRKDVRLAERISAREGRGGTHVVYKAECGHEVPHFEAAHNPEEDATKSAGFGQVACPTCHRDVDVAHSTDHDACLGVCGHHVTCAMASTATKGADNAPSGALKDATYGEAPCEDCGREVAVRTHDEAHEHCEGDCGHAVKCRGKAAIKAGVPSGQGEAAEPGAHTGEGQAHDRRIEQQERDIAARMRQAVEDYAKANTGEGGAEEGRENRALAQLKELLDAAVSQQQREAIETGDVGAPDTADGHSSDVAKGATRAAIQKAALVLVEAGALDQAAVLLATVGKAGRRIKKERLDRLRDHHKRLGDLIDELDDEKIAADKAEKDRAETAATDAARERAGEEAYLREHRDKVEKAARPDNDGAAPLVTRTQVAERIRAEIGMIGDLWRELEASEPELIHDTAPAGNLGPDQQPIAPARKPSADGTWDLRRQDATTRALREAGEETRALYKRADLTTAFTEALERTLPRVNKAAADQIAAALAPLAAQVDALAHQPVGVTRADLYVADRPTEFGASQPALHKVAEDFRGQFRNMSPTEQQQHAAALIGEARRQQGARGGQ